MVDCRNKTNKSTLLKNYVEQTLSYFNDFHRRIKEVNILIEKKLFPFLILFYFLHNKPMQLN